MKIILLMTLLLIPNSILAKDIWIYSDDGAWSDGIIAFEQFLNYKGLSHKRIYAVDLNNSSDYSLANAICFPGGFAYNYKLKLEERTINNIRNYVEEGGSYIGICAGAYFATSSVVWEGIDYSYTLGLFKGRAVGSIHEIASWDNYCMTTIVLNQNNSIVTGFEQEYNVLYYGGPYFESNEMDFDVLATWKDYNEYPSIINFNYKKGKVLLIGPHLEIETNSDRDSSSFAEELEDIESDWEILGTIVSWVISSETSNSNNSSNNLGIYPNPASEYIEIRQPTEGSEVKIYNTLGECVLTVETRHAVSLQRIDISHLPVGLYFIRIGNYSEKFMVIR
ncbi:MAG: BPL-N domain-containing protein [Candidatus Kapabacteria bacterium]|nr:BPL-N domain-containing protein [Candidatus Kapabacteria bacterium]